MTSSSILRIYHGPRARRQSLHREPVQQRSRERVQRILDAAVQIVTTEGTDAATVRSVADRAGAPAATVYQFFTSRDAIFEQRLARELVRLDGELEESLATARPHLDIAAAVEAFFDFHRRHYMSTRTSSRCSQGSPR
ncbi:TetR/AcrR family transcriptional regulator [Nocardia sp. CA-129566]|uniref:TetR/AcrR family transcriptional regulator n=1 Tax=Nocardia sp. CA-129566 TaxID=3239976 RepID=UPI003D966907